MSTEFNTNYKVDVDSLFGLSRPSVPQLAVKGIQADLSLLQTLETGTQPSPFTADDVAHYQEINDSYLCEHPLGFLAASSPIIAQSMLQDALRRDVVKRIGAYNFANGNFKDLQDPIAALHAKGSDEFVSGVQAAFSAIHRNVIIKTASDMDRMAKLSHDGLWGTINRDEREFVKQFQTSAHKLDHALALFDRGETDAAMALYSEVMEKNGGYVSWFERALKTSEHEKFAPHIGIAMAAGAAAYFTGGASLLLLGGEEASLAAYITSMFISGTSMTVTSRELNAVVFDKSFFGRGTTLDKTIDFGGDVLQNTALMGWLRLGNVAGAAIPMMEGEPVLATTFNAARGFAIEFGNFTSFNMVSSASNLFDENRPSIDDAISKQSLAENAAFILGLRVGHGSLSGAKIMTRWGVTTATDYGNRFLTAFNTPRVAQFLLSPLAIFTMIPSGGMRLPSTGVTDKLSELLRTSGVKNTAVEIYQRRPYKFWGIMNLLDMGIPSALVAYRILRLQVDADSHALMQEFQSIVKLPEIQEGLTQIRDQGMRAYLTTNGINMSPDKFKNGADFMDRVARAYSKMQSYIETFTAAAAAAGHFVGMEYEGRTHYGLFEESVWLDDETVNPQDPNSLSARDRLAVTLHQDLTEMGHEVDFVSGKQHFGYTPYPVIFPTIFERYRVGNDVVKVEILTGTGAVIVSVRSENNPNKAKTEHVKGAKSVFDPAVETKVAEMIARALQLNTDDEDPEDAIAILRKNKGGYDRKYLIQAKAADNDILKIWVTFNPHGYPDSAVLAPINGKILDEKHGDYVNSIVIPAKTYEDVHKWMIDHAAGNPVFAKKVDQYEGVNIKGFGVVTLTDEAHPYKELVSPKLSHDKIPIWLDVVDVLSNVGITGTTPYNLVGIHTHGNLRTKLEEGPDAKFSILPALGILRGFVTDTDMIYDGIPSHDNRLGFIQKLPLWFRERLQDPSYVTDPTSRRQILRVAADLARDVKKYNAMNLSNHISALLAKMIETGTFQDGETLEDNWQGEDYHFRVMAGDRPETHDIIREIDCATYTVETHGNTGAITNADIAEGWVSDRTAKFLRNTLNDFAGNGDLAKLAIGKDFQRVVKYQGDDFLFKVARTTASNVSVHVQQQVHLMRVAKDARKTTGELRIFDSIFDRDTGKFFLDFYHAWSWWHGSGQFLNPSLSTQFSGALKSAQTFVQTPPSSDEWRGDH